MYSAFVLALHIASATLSHEVKIEICIDPSGYDADKVDCKFINYEQPKKCRLPSTAH